jgi:hypothetical protein
MFGYSERFADHRYAQDEATDFICFTDDKALVSDHWKVRYVDPRPLGPVRTSKQVKILAHRFVGSYAASLYIDNTVRLRVSPAELFAMLEASAVPMLCFRHFRTCLYAEAEEIVKLGYDDPAVVEAQITHYRQAGHPKDAGLISASILLRRHNDPSIRMLMEKWFEQVATFSYRDQLSFNFVAKRHGFVPSYFEGLAHDNKFMDWPVIDGPRLPRDFQDERYLNLHPDVKAAGMNPRQHYLKHGLNEKRPYK